MEKQIKWAIVTGTGYVTRGKGLAWTHAKAEAESWANVIPGARVVDGEEFIQSRRAKCPD